MFLPMSFMDHAKIAEGGDFSLANMLESRKVAMNHTELKSILLKDLPNFLYKGYLD